MTLPNFLIIGAMRTSTTSLYNYLGQHPAVFMSTPKEPQYFAAEEIQQHVRPGYANEMRPVRTLSEYESLFRDVNEQHRAWGEASVRYLFSPNAAGQIQARLPDVKMIAMLRDPVERGYSQFLSARRRGDEPEKDFETAFHLWEARVADGWDPYTFGYKQVGLYSAQLERYLNLFPREQMRIHLYDDLKQRSESLIADLFRYLGVDPRFEVDFSQRHNPTLVPRRYLVWLTSWRSPARRLLYAESSGVKRVLRAVARPLVPKHLHGNIGTHLLYSRRKPALDDATRKRLRSHFREDLLRTQDLIERDLSHWLEH